MSIWRNKSTNDKTKNIKVLVILISSNGKKVFDNVFKNFIIPFYFILVRKQGLTIIRIRLYKKHSIFKYIHYLLLHYSYNIVIIISEYLNKLTRWCVLSKPDMLFFTLIYNLLSVFVLQDSWTELLASAALNLVSTEKFPLVSMGGWREGIACADPG